MCVESVAWISEQKNTLSTFFYLAAGLAYLGFAENRRTASYALATGWFVLALLSKSVTASLQRPCWWCSGGAAALVPAGRHPAVAACWFILGAGFGLFNIGGADRDWRRGAAFALSLAQRSLVAGRAIWFTSASWCGRRR